MMGIGHRTAGLNQILGPPVGATAILELATACVVRSRGLRLREGADLAVA